MVIKFIAATLNCSPERGDAFTKENLVQLHNNINCSDRLIPILDNFNADKVIGKVNTSELLEAALYVEGELINSDFIPMYIVPGFKVNDLDYDGDTDTVIFKDIELISMGMVNEPQDIGVTKFEVLHGRQ